MFTILINLINKDNVKEISPKYKVDKFNADNSNVPSGMLKEIV